MNFHESHYFLRRKFKDRQCFFAIDNLKNVGGRHITNTGTVDLPFEWPPFQDPSDPPGESAGEARVGLKNEKH